MNGLKLPEQMKGNWHHALFVTYGADLPFFETALWRQFQTNCRNKIILADGHRLLEGFVHYAENRLARRVNHSYVADGIFVPRTAHAKLILLTSPKRGRLLVGSGNLGWQGYASGGELFTAYDYDAEADDGTQKINPFLDARAFIETLIHRGYITGAMAQMRLRHLFENTRWFYRSAVGDWHPVRHNLTTSFLQHIREVIGDNPVDELWIASPFYDKKAKALKRLLKTFAPKKTALLVQPGQTSIDPSVLQTVLNTMPQCEVRVAQRRANDGSADNTYLHAKFYLFKLPKKAVCLQGSPNLSQVAMLKTAPEGNIELANLLTGTRKAFDYLLDALIIEPPTRHIKALDLRFDASNSTPSELTGEWRLTGGELDDDRIRLTYSGTLPALVDSALMVGSFILPGEIATANDGLQCTLPDTATVDFSHPVPVRVRWNENGETQISNPVFICHRAALDAALEISDDTQILPRIGDLEIEDREIEQLLGELQSSLVIDRRSVWQAAGHTLPNSSSTDDNDDTLHLSYADIDYEALRQHPKFSQYRTGSAGTGGQPRTRLQMILSAITNHFNEVLQPAHSAPAMANIIAALDANTANAESEEEAEADAEARERRHWSQNRRIRRILQNFITRYLRGVRNDDFREMVGHEVMAHNYIIFSHILWRLLSKEWASHEFIIESFLQLWHDFWGFSTRNGYYFQLPLEQQADVLGWLADKHTPAAMLATVYYSDFLVRSEKLFDLRMELRDFWRAFLQYTPFTWTEKIIEEAWRLVGSMESYQTPPPAAIFEALQQLANYETELSLLRALEDFQHVPAHSCHFEEVSIFREALSRSATEKCLVIKTPDALADPAAAQRWLRHWMRLETLDYYRLAAPDSNGSAITLFYEQTTGKGVFWARHTGAKPADFGNIMPLPTPWDDALTRLQTLVAQVDANLQWQPIRISENAKNA